MVSPTKRQSPRQAVWSVHSIATITVVLARGGGGECECDEGGRGDSVQVGAVVQLESRAQKSLFVLLEVTVDVLNLQ